MIHACRAGELVHLIHLPFLQFAVGLPTFVPSIQLGAFSTITPLKSPPPSLRSLFDFAIAGPLVGSITSIGFLVVGLVLTTSMDQQTVADLPALPMYLLRSSSLGGGLIELFLGKGVLMRDIPSDVVLPLHPFAVAGYVGLIYNALALLPLGRTYDTTRRAPARLCMVSHLL